MPATSPGSKFNRQGGSKFGRRGQSLDEQASREWDASAYAHAQASLRRRIRTSNDMAKAAQLLVRLKDVRTS